ncbi:acyl-ACP thioesterase domain-containing protein [uncultured Thalassospira sp.]|uniref:acyl-[acyl-carrier-protein] thioesterase n=1 Tax=uncultured Thalassospira sp. TaxID=404382 RepID=UPI0030DAFF09|tara:strand:+ start:1808 stop:2596 length:789 start_codon:yes stop_codon:yes gene_type:complete
MFDPDWTKIATAPLPDNCGWRGQYRVRYSEIGQNGLATLPALADYMQDAAGWGAKRLALAYDDTVDRGVAWVLARMAIIVRHYPANGETITLETWPSGFAHRMASRDFRLIDDSGTVCAVAQNFWSLFDLQARRAVHWPDWLIARLPDPPGPKLIDLAPRTPPPPANMTVADHITARASDLDVYGHVNNVRLMQWVLAASGPNRTADFQPASLDIQFRAECRLRDKVEIRQADGYATISRRDLSDGKTGDTDLVRAQFTHQP